MPFDLEQLRSHFPSLDSGIAHFDGPGGTQTPDVVGLAIASTLTGPLSNRGRNAASEVKADEAVLQFRRAFADFLNMDRRSVVYGRSATQLTYDFSRHLSRQWGPGDEIIVTRLDHDSNIRPWVQAAERQGATVRWVGFDAGTAELNMDELERSLTSRTRLAAVTAASNVLGTMPDIAAIAAKVHDAGALLYVDGVHYAAHHAVDLQALGADFFVCSPYKFLGPHCAVLAAAPSLLESIQPDKLLPSTNIVPERFEFGTLPYEIMAGATAAVDFIASLGSEGSRRERLVTAFESIESHEQTLQDELERALEAMPGVVLHSLAKARTSTMLLTFEDHTAGEVGSFLAGRNILAPAGHFYAIEASRALGLGDDGGLRIGLAPYTSRQDIRRLIDGLAEFLRQ
ncbi:cysteine desulfurase-like protein [Arthrobacter castelli]|uniref:cysteine desulfurase-like protein n=1 Tax=Arthrobacter castelli TaxID=271431 RepID=UPI0003F7D160|nr:cysteine desulfurase-like protein [Arthrobacter castelli]